MIKSAEIKVGLKAFNKMRQGCCQSCLILNHVVCYMVCGVRMIGEEIRLLVLLLPMLFLIGLLFFMFCKWIISLWKTFIPEPIRNSDYCVGVNEWGFSDQGFVEIEPGPYNHSKVNMDFMSNVNLFSECVNNGGCAFFYIKAFDDVDLSNVEGVFDFFNYGLEGFCYFDDLLIALESVSGYLSCIPIESYLVGCLSREINEEEWGRYDNGQGEEFENIILNAPGLVRFVFQISDGCAYQLVEKGSIEQELLIGNIDRGRRKYLEGHGVSREMIEEVLSENKIEKAATGRKR